MADTSCGDRSVQSGIRCRLNVRNSSFATGSPLAITRCEERMNLSSHGRCRRTVTPFRSGPTFTPLPNV